MPVRLVLSEDAPPAGGTVHRALRRDVRFPFVALGGEGAAYEIVHEDGTVDIEGGVLLIAAYAVPEGEDIAFGEAFARHREVLAGQRGYLGTRLLRAIEATPLRFAALARWSSPLMYARALALPELEPVGFPSDSALYLPHPG
jgi:hypothetical protein